MVEREIVKKKQFSSRNNRIVEPRRFNSRFEKLPLSFASLSLSLSISFPRQTPRASMKYRRTRYFLTDKP